MHTHVLSGLFRTIVWQQDHSSPHALRQELQTRQFAGCVPKASELDVLGRANTIFSAFNGEVRWNQRLQSPSLQTVQTHML